MIKLPGDEFRAFVEARMQTKFSAAYPGVPVRFENAQFKQPAAAPWGAFYILPGTSFKAHLGRTYVERTPGLIQIDMLVPENTGHAQADRMAEQAARFFVDQHFPVGTDHVARFRGVQVRSLGCHSGFYRCSARVPFEHDAVMTQQSA